MLTYVYSWFHLDWVSVILLKLCINMLRTLKLGYHFRLINFQSKCVHDIETRTTFRKLSQTSSTHKHSIEGKKSMGNNFQSERSRKKFEFTLLGGKFVKVQMLLRFEFYDTSAIFLLSSTISITMYTLCLFGGNYSHFQQLNNAAPNLIDRCPFTISLLFRRG